jgi:hypothetical protein
MILPGTYAEEAIQTRNAATGQTETAEDALAVEFTYDFLFDSFSEKVPASLAGLALASFDYDAPFARSNRAAYVAWLDNRDERPTREYGQTIGEWNYEAWSVEYAADRAAAKQAAEEEAAREASE